MGIHSPHALTSLNIGLRCKHAGVCARPRALMFYIQCTKLQLSSNPQWLLNCEVCKELESRVLVERKRAACVVVGRHLVSKARS
jgi:hypothetical protein